MPRVGGRNQETRIKEEKEEEKSVCVCACVCVCVGRGDGGAGRGRVKKKVEKKVGNEQTRLRVNNNPTVAQKATGRIG
jgi:hypothetical protein